MKIPSRMIVMCHPVSTKLHIVNIEEKPDGRFCLMGYFGSVDSKTRSRMEIPKSCFSKLKDAQRKLEEVHVLKSNAGFVRIKNALPSNSNVYDAVLSIIGKASVGNKETKSEDPVLVVCVNNQGVEDKFDIDLEYFMIGTDRGFFVVIDCNGDQQKCNNDRFRII